MLNRKQMILIFMFLFGAALTGVVLGGIVVGNTMPVPPLQIALFAVVNLSLFVLGLGVILWSQTKEAQLLINRTSRHSSIQVRTEYPRAGVVVKDSNPESPMREHGTTDQAHAMSSRAPIDERG